MRRRLVPTLTVAAPGWIVIGSLALPVEIGIAGRAFAQQPAAPDPGTWTGTAGAGLALTSGNSDTLNFKEREMLREFKEFAMRGNVVEMAGGIIIAAAVGAIVSRLRRRRADADPGTGPRGG